MSTNTSWKRVTVWSGTLIVAAVLLALLAAGIQPQTAAADEPAAPKEARLNGEPIFISTWGSGEISQTRPGMTTTEIVTYTGSDILMWTPVYDARQDAQTDWYWVKWFDGIAAGLNPYRQWKHNLNAIWVSPTVEVRNGMNGGPFYASLTQNQRRGVPGIDGWVDGYDILYWNGYSFTRWFEGEDVGLTNKTQEKIDSLEILPAIPEGSAFISETCEAYILISTQGPGHVPAPVPTRAKPVIKFRGEDVLGFCATNLGENTTGFWELVMDGSELEPRLRPRDVDSISSTPDPGVFAGMANRARPYHSMLFAYDLLAQTVTGPMLDFADLGITSPVDALHIMVFDN